MNAPTIPSNLVDYEQTRAAFSWEDAFAELGGSTNDRMASESTINIAYEAVDVHGRGTRAEHVAIRWLPKRGAPVDLTYGDLSARTSRFASAMTTLFGAPGFRVATLAGRIPELYVAALGTLKGGGVYTPLFSAFGPEPIRQRVDLGEIEVLVTTARLYRRKVASLDGSLPSLRHVILVGERDDMAGTVTAGGVAIHWWDDLMASADPDFPAATTSRDDLALLHFTSGTTGTPKGAMHVHRAVVAHKITARFALDLRPDDVFWCTADPGWVTGTSYGIIAPLVHGATCIVDEAEFDADRWYQTIETNQVTVWYTAPTAVRMMMRIGEAAVRDYDLTSLRVIASVGEPLNPEAVTWGQKAFGRPILDNWWQTETGGIMIANYCDVPVKPGSMGRPMPGIDIAVLQRDTNGDLVLGADGQPIEAAASEIGELAIKAGWPSMFVGYLDMDERYAKCFVGDWYRSGDLARFDADGYYWFVGRGDDLIKSAGHLIGPFEVESVLIEHPQVSEAGVIGLPDETVGEVVKGYVSLAPGVAESDEVIRDIMGFARKKLGPAVAPRTIEVRAVLPKTRSGKIMRRLLKARELGLPEGDISTLETGADQ